MNKEYGNGAQTFERKITKGVLNCNNDELDYLKSLINKFYLRYKKDLTQDLYDHITFVYQDCLDKIEIKEAIHIIVWNFTAKYIEEKDLNMNDDLDLYPLMDIDFSNPVNRVLDLSVFQTCLINDMERGHLVREINLFLE